MLLGGASGLHIYLVYGVLVRHSITLTPKEYPLQLRYETSVSEFGISVLKVSYPACETIELDLTDLFKDTTHFETLYEPVNDYVATLPAFIQRQIYDVFYRLYVNDYKNNFDDPVVLTKMEVKIKQVSELLGYENFKIWVRQNSDGDKGIIYPEVIKDEYVVDPDMNTTREKTYIKGEYTDLVALIAFLRALAPLYIDFYNRIKQVTPHYYYKVFMLFVRSDLTYSKEIDKLKTYIDVNQQTLIGGGKKENLILFAGLSDDDLLPALLAEVIFNKLLPIDVYNKKCNIISFVYQTVKYKGNYATSGGQNIRGKTVDNNSARDDISYFEDYRKTSSVPIGTVVEIQHSLSDIQSLVLASGVERFDFNAYDEEVARIGNYLTFKLDNVQIYLLSWFMGKIINPRAMFYIEYRKLLELMLFAKVVLASEGLHYMAMLISAQKSNEPGFLSAVIRNSLGKASVKRLAKAYGVCMEDDKTSVVEKTILEIGKEISNTTWVPIGSAEGVASVATVGGFLETPGNLNDLLLEYVEFVNK